VTPLKEPSNPLSSRHFVSRALGETIDAYRFTSQFQALVHLPSVPFFSFLSPNK
jgi:hypothetical protein